MYIITLLLGRDPSLLSCNGRDNEVSLSTTLLRVWRWLWFSSWCFNSPLLHEIVMHQSFNTETPPKNVCNLRFAAAVRKSPRRHTRSSASCTLQHCQILLCIRFNVRERLATSRSTDTFWKASWNLWIALYRYRASLKQAINTFFPFPQFSVALVFPPSPLGSICGLSSQHRQCRRHLLPRNAPAWSLPMKKL